MFGRLFKSLYNQVFVNIIIAKHKSVVYIEICNHKGISISTAQESFKTKTPDEKMMNFINSHAKETPYIYISLLDTALEQGVLPACQNITKYIKTSDYFTKCYGKWTYYTSKNELNEQKNSFKELGLDLVYSPFLILSNFFADKIPTHLSLYALVEETHLSLCVFDNGVLLYGEHLVMKSGEVDESLEDANEEELIFDDDEIDLAGVSALDDELDSFGDIENLDDFEEIEDFAEVDDLEEELDEQIALEKGAYETKEPSGFNDDYQRFSMIQKAIGRFYRDERYESKFIETIFIADGVGVSGDLKRFLEDEMFLSVFVRRVDLGIELCELAKSEIL